MANKSVIDKLSSNAEPRPADVEVVPPNKDLEIQLTRHAIELNAKGRDGIAAEMPKPAVEQVPAVAEVQRREPPPSPTPPDDPIFRNAAAVIVRKFMSLSTEWNLRIEAMRLERHLTDEQIVVSLMAHTLDTGEYMVVPADHPYFTEAFKPAGYSFACVMCGTVGSAKYAGQKPLCYPDNGKQCGTKFHKLPLSEQEERLQAA